MQTEEKGTKNIVTTFISYMKIASPGVKSGGSSLLAQDITAKTLTKMGLPVVRVRLPRILSWTSSIEQELGTHMPREEPESAP